MAPVAVERELRTRFSKSEYIVLQSRLTGAVKALQALHDRAPDLLPLMFDDGLDHAKALPLQTRGALATLIQQLLIAAATTARGRVDRQALMRLVTRVEKGR